MITYSDKVQYSTNLLPDVNQWRAADANEVKTQVNLALSKSVNWYNVLAYGLVADNTTDNSAALSALIASIPASSTVYFPIGYYRFSTGLTIAKQINIKGDGVSTRLVTNQNITLFNYDNSGTPIGGILLEDVQIDNDTAGTPSSASIALRANTPFYWKVRGVGIHGFYKNVQLLNPVDDVWDDFSCTGYVSTGMERISSSPYVDSGDACISNSRFIPYIRNCVYSIFQSNGGGLKITNTKFNFDNSGPFRANYHYYYNGTGATVDLNISNCSFENCSTAYIRIGKSSGSFSQISIIGNDIGATSATNIKGIIVDGVNELAILGNTFRSNTSTTTAIELTDVNDAVIFNEYKGWNNNVVQNGTCTNIQIPVIQSQTITIDGVSQDLSANRTWNTSGVAGNGYKSVTGTDTLTTSDFYKTIYCSGTSADYTVNLPTAVGNTGSWFRFVGAPSLTKIVTIDGNSSETINGITTRALANRGGFVIVSDGSNWVVSSETPSNIAYTPGTLTGFASPTTVCSYSLIGKMMTVHFSVSSAAGSGTTAQISIPSGFTVNSQATRIIRVRSNTYAAGMALIGSGNTFMDIYATPAGGAFTNGQAREAYGDITFEVQ